MKNSAMRLSAIERDRLCREMVAGIQRDDLYPAYRKKDMDDCTFWLHSDYWDGWENYARAILSFTRPLARGEREFDEEAYRKSFRYFCDDEILGMWDVAILPHYLMRYHVYLCSDGKLRYYRDEGTDKMIRYDEELEYREYCRMFQELERKGYTCVENGGFWVNYETGDIYLDPNP